MQDPLVLSLLWGYLKRVVNDGGWWRPITQGISLGCPLSPLMGALYLKPLDDRMAQLGDEFHTVFQEGMTRYYPGRLHGVAVVLVAANSVMMRDRPPIFPASSF